MDDIFLLTAEQEAHYSTMYSIVTDTLKNYEYQPDTPETREYKKTTSQGITVYLWYKESAEAVRQELIRNGYNIRIEHEQLKTIMKGHYFVAGLFPADTRHALLYTSTNPHKGIIMPNYEETLPILMVLSFSQPRSEQAEYWRKVRELLSANAKIKLPIDSKFLNPSLWTAIHELRAILEELATGKTNEIIDHITEITRSDYFGQPIAKLFRRQVNIAREGEADVYVGDDADNKPVIVPTSISDIEGNPLALSEFHVGIQRAVGNLIDEAGGANFLPITVTPAQIYRAFIRAKYSVRVTDQQAREIEEGMDYLLFAPSKIDFEIQLKKHPGIKQQSDYDYNADGAGKRKQTLIVGIKDEASSNNGNRVTAYHIFAYPAFYAYSHIINQMAWVPNELLTGGDKSPIRTEKKGCKTAEAQGNTRTIAIRDKVLREILFKCGQASRKEAYNHHLKTASIADQCGIALTPQTERTVRKTIQQYLEELTRQGIVKKYSEYKKARKIEGFTINVYPRKFAQEGGENEAQIPTSKAQIPTSKA